MGCCPDNKEELNEINKDKNLYQNYFNAYEIIKKYVILMTNKNQNISDVILIKAKSIEYFLQLIEKSQVLKYLLNQPTELEKHEITLLKLFHNYKLEENIKILNYNDCKASLNSEKIKENEFIIADINFLIDMGISTKNILKIEIEKDNINMKIKFPSKKEIYFQEIKLGLYQFLQNGEKRKNIEESKNINNFNSLTEENNNLINNHDKENICKYNNKNIIIFSQNNNQNNTFNSLSIKVKVDSKEESLILNKKKGIDNNINNHENKYFNSKQNLINKQEQNIFKSKNMKNENLNQNINNNNENIKGNNIKDEKYEVSKQNNEKNKEIDINIESLINNNSDINFNNYNINDTNLSYISDGDFIEATSRNSIEISNKKNIIMKKDFIENISNNINNNMINDKKIPINYIKIKSQNDNIISSNDNININNKEYIKQNNNIINKNNNKKNKINIINNNIYSHYIKIIIQLLLNINSLKNYFLNKKRNSSIFKDNQQKIISKVLFDILDNFHDNNYLNSDYLLEIIRKNSNIFIDSNEINIKNILSFLYQELHVELNEKDKKNEIEEFYSEQTVPEIELYKCLNNFEIQNKSIISDIFYFSQAHIIKCLNCEVLLYNFVIDNILFFSLEKIKLYKQGKNIPFDNINLYDCFEYYLDEEKTSEDKKHCKLCNQDSYYIEYNKLSSLPGVFTIFLYKKKINILNEEFHIDYILENLDNYILKFNNINKQIFPKYELTGIGIEEKKEEDDDHFLYYFKSSQDKKWYLLQDYKVENICSPKDIIKGIPNFLIYEKINDK